jgi:hypothetical protein
VGGGWLRSMFSSALAWRTGVVVRHGAHRAHVVLACQPCSAQCVASLHVITHPPTPQAASAAWMMTAALPAAAAGAAAAGAAAAGAAAAAAAAAAAGVRHMQWTLWATT